MKHPNREEWVQYLYEEAKPSQREQLKAHFDACGQCRGEFESWQRSVERLDAWQLPPRPQPARLAMPSLAWAAAAVFLLLIGLGVGRFTTVRAETERSRAAVAAARQEIRNQVAELVRAEVATAATAMAEASTRRTEEFLTEFARSVESGRTEDRATVASALERLERQRARDFLALKKDLDTVAVNADARFRRTQQDMAQLVDYR
jgi:hypothetical protein